MSEIERLQRQINDLKAQVKDAYRYEIGRFVQLTAPLTSTSWDGDSFSTTAKTLIDLSAVFSVPAGVRAVLVVTGIRDAASAGGDYYLCLSPNSTAGSGPKTGCGGLANDKFGLATYIVPCNADGDIYYQIVASGADTMDVYLEIWGYWL